MQIEYLDQKMLLLPVERFDLVQKYSGVEDVAPVLDRLGSAGWGKRKASVRRAMRDMTDQLLKLYARRSTAEGFAFSKDSPWQKEFEDAFEHVETADQAQAIADVSDMQSSKPMDRLLGQAVLWEDGSGHAGGDEGRARRQAGRPPRADDDPRRPALPDVPAALRGVPGRHRAALALPLEGGAEGGRREGRRRLGRHPHRDAPNARQGPRVSRPGAPDRRRGAPFRVAQKERLKEWMPSIDVLAMSATPIPRTLHLALSGVRDLTVIETPPRDRLAIETQVVPARPEVIRDAIDGEVERGGQVWFVHNRVESIARVADDEEVRAGGPDRRRPRADGGGGAREGPGRLRRPAVQRASCAPRSSRTASTSRR